MGYKHTPFYRSWYAVNVNSVHIRKGALILNKRKMGAKQEALATKYLENKGFLILDRNYFCKYAEIDIIAKDGDYLVFCEVKYRSGFASGFPEEAVNYIKQRNMTSGAYSYMIKNRIPPDQNVRFDVIAILGNEIKHYENAFEAVE